MAIDLCTSETLSIPSNVFAPMSPRISFSHDLSQTDMVQEKVSSIQRQDSLLLVEAEDSNLVFDFNVSESFEGDSSFIAADELFSGGKLMPVQIKKPQPQPQRVVQEKQQKPPTVPPRKETLRENTEKSGKPEEKQQKKSVWGFKRSNSCGGAGVSRMNLICSLPSLLRSKSTGSDTKGIEKSRSQKSSLSSSSSSSSSSTMSKSSSYPYSTSSKSQVKKNYGAYGDGVRISPVLNLPSAYNSKGNVNLFGMGSIFSGKDKKNKKKS